MQADPNWALVAIAALNMITAFFSWRTHVSQTKSANTIDLLEKNTNSIKDALVDSTAKVNFAAGANQARIVGEDKAAAVAAAVAKEAKK